MNDAGLAVSLAFGGRPGAGAGFGIPLVLRYCWRSPRRSPTPMRCWPAFRSVWPTTSPCLTGGVTWRRCTSLRGFKPEVAHLPVATNHRGTVPDWPEHARTFHSVQRQRFLLDLLARRPGVDGLVAAFLRPPLHSERYAEAFGTMYTAVYPTRSRRGGLRLAGFELAAWLRVSGRDPLGGPRAERLNVGHLTHGWRKCAPWRCAQLGRSRRGDPPTSSPTSLRRRCARWPGKATRTPSLTCCGCPASSGSASAHRPGP